MAWSDISYTIEKSSLYAGFKHLIVEWGGGEAFRTAAGAGAAALTFGVTLPVLATLGMLAAVSAGLSQMDYFHKRNTLKSLYREEAAAKLGKPVNKLSKDDFEVLAADNPTLADEVAKAKRQRNFGVAMSFVASVASVAVVALGMPAMGYDHNYFHAMMTGAEFLINGAVGVLAYNAVKAPLHWIADKLFGLDKETAHDRIVALSHHHVAGRAVAPEQVLSVYAAANRQLDRFIETEYGKSFDKMKPAERQKIAIDIGKLVPLTRLAQDINSGKLKPTALALATAGEDIGALEQALAQQPAKPGMMSALWQTLRRSARLDAVPETGHVAVASVPNGIVVEYASEQPGRSFVQRLGVSRSDTLGHVGRVEQSRMAVLQRVPDVG
ncbi:MAG: hypothetical protein KGI29_02435 [Pseudomonadota bacterium]|nr:hypothetical protein [Pseudomonadota bacterium]